LDCPNISRIDGANIEKYSEVIKIDHHPFEDKMGTIEWVDESSSSTAEMITELLISARFRANKSIAENLFMGVVADSDRFLFGTTSPKTLELMAILIKNSKIDIASIYPRLYLRPLSEVKFQSYITEHLKVSSSGFASMKIDKKVIEKYGVDAGTASNLVNNFNNIEEILCWALVSYDEKQKIYKVNIRSRGPIINEVASKYNGGGHAMASGAKITNMQEVDALLNELEETCKTYKKELKESENVSQENTEFELTEDKEDVVIVEPEIVPEKENIEVKEKNTKKTEKAKKAEKVIKTDNKTKNTAKSTNKKKATKKKSTTKKGKTKKK